MPFETGLAVSVDSRGARMGAAQVNRAMDGMSRRARRTVTGMNTQFASLKTMIAGTGALMGTAFGVAGVRSAIGVISGFESSMSGVQAVTRATAEEMDALRGRAQEMGALTRFSAGQAAEGMQFLGMAGFDVQQIMQSMPAMLNVAAAGMLDLGRAADIVSNIMAPFRLQAEESTRVADVLAQVASSSNTSIEQLGQAMKFAAPMAAALNISVEDTAATLGALGNAGLQATLGGTGFRILLASLIKTTPKARDALAQFGLTAEEVNPSIVSWETALQRLVDANIDATAATEILTVRGANAFLALKAQADVLMGPGGLLEGAAQAAGRAAEMASTRMDNLEGDYLQLISVIQALILATGEDGLTGALRGLTQDATDVLRVFAGYEDQLVGSTEQATLLADAITGIGGALAILVGRFALVKAGAAGLALATSPAAWGLAAVAAVVAYRDEIAKMATGVGDAEVVVKSAFDEMTERVTDFSDTAVVEMDGYKVSVADLADVTVSSLHNAGSAWLELQGFIVETLATLTGADKVLGEFFRATRNRAIETIKARAEGEGAGFSGARFGSGVPGSVKELGETLDFIAERDFGKSRSLDKNPLGLAGAFFPGEEGRAERERLADEILGNLGGGGGSGGAADVDQRAEAFESLRRSLDGAYAAQREFEEGERLIAHALNEGMVTTTQAADLSALLARERRAAMLAAEEQLDPLGRIIKGLREENQILSASFAERSVISQMRRIENDLMRQGVDLTREQRVAVRELVEANEELARPAPWDRYVESLRDVGDQMDRALVRGAQSASDAIAEMVTQGRFDLESLSSVLQSVAQQMASLAIQQALFGESGGFGGGFFGRLFGGGSSSSIANPGALAGSAFAGSFATGGSFTVPGSGGTDSQLVSLRATPGERISVRRPADGADGGVTLNAPITITMQGGGGNADDRQAQVIARRVRDELDGLVDQRLRKHMRPNGMLNGGA